MGGEIPRSVGESCAGPDIVRWSDKQRELWLLELTISFEPPVADAHERKQAKYLDLLEAGKGAGFETEVGSHGMLCATDFNFLRAAINDQLKEVTTLCLEVIRITLLESFRIWCSRNSGI